MYGETSSQSSGVLPKVNNLNITSAICALKPVLTTHLAKPWLCRGGVWRISLSCDEVRLFLKVTFKIKSNALSDGTFNFFLQ